jgi:mRNA-binding protein PUF3
MMMQSQLYRQQYPVPTHYEYNYGNGVRLSLAPYPGSPISPLVAPTHPARRAPHEDFGHNLRSVLLEEFRSNSKSNKRYELKVIPIGLIVIIFC